MLLGDQKITGVIVQKKSLPRGLSGRDSTAYAAILPELSLVPLEGWGDNPGAERACQTRWYTSGIAAGDVSSLVGAVGVL